MAAGEQLVGNVARVRTDEEVCDDALRSATAPPVSGPGLGSRECAALVERLELEAETCQRGRSLASCPRPVRLQGSPGAAPGTVRIGP